MNEEEVKKEFELGDIYEHPGSSTGSNHQVRVTRQNNFIIYLTKELNKNISKLNEEIKNFRVDIKDYNDQNGKYTKAIIGLTIVMGLFALVQVFLLLNERFGWF